jgi:thiamine biosynthesis lipoprotein
MRFEAIGTHWLITTKDTLASDIQQSILDRIETFDQTYSRFRKDSLITKIAQKAGEYTFPKDAKILFDFYRKLYDLTDGKVTPLIGKTLENAGYDAEYSLQPKPQVEVPRWDDVLEINGVTLVAKKPVTLDFGAAGKGYLVDIICQLLDDAKIDDYIVDASGDLRHKGTMENRVGLEDPRQSGTVIGVVDVQNQSLCASATNRRTWGKYHHVFDPDTKDSTKAIVATWVITDSAMVADGIATSLFFVSPSVVRNAFTYEYVRMHVDESIDYSPTFEDKLFLN